MQRKEPYDKLDSLEEVHQYHTVSAPTTQSHSYNHDHAISAATQSSMRITDSGDEVWAKSSYLGHELNNNKSTKYVRSSSPCKELASRGPVPGYTPYEQMHGSKFRLNTVLNVSSNRVSPLPSLQWADSKEVSAYSRCRVSAIHPAQ